MNQEIILYQLDEANIYVDVYYKNETFWLTQKTMAELFDVNVPAISKHLRNIFDEEELEESVTVSKMEIVQQEGSRQVIMVLVFKTLPETFFNEFDIL